MIAAQGRVEIGDHTMFANGCFVGDAEHRFDDPETPITQQGFTRKGPVEIGSNCWFGVNCVVTSGVTIGERCVIGANSVVTRDLPAGHDRRRGSGEADQGGKIDLTPRCRKTDRWSESLGAVPGESHFLATAASRFVIARAPRSAAFELDALREGFGAIQASVTATALFGPRRSGHTRERCESLVSPIGHGVLS